MTPFVTAPRWYWMQPGTENKEAAERAEAAGLKAVIGACMRMVHRTLPER